MLPPKGAADNAKTNHSRSDVDPVTLSEEPCYYCKKYPCVCDGTPFKKSTSGSETLQDEQRTTDALSPFKKSAVQCEDDNPDPQNDSTLAGCPIRKRHTCACQQSRPTSKVLNPTDDGDRLCVICWEYGCKKHPKSN